MMTTLLLVGVGYLAVAGLAYLLGRSHGRREASTSTQASETVNPPEEQIDPDAVHAETKSSADSSSGDSNTDGSGFADTVADLVARAERKSNNGTSAGSEPGTSADDDWAASVAAKVESAGK